MIRGIKVLSPKKAATGFGGGRTYLSGVADWNGSETPVFVFFKEEEDEKVEQMVLSSSMTFDAGRYDFVVGHGLSLWDAELK